MTEPAPYRVLARKYRPQRFSELIGQEAMVRTLGNAISSGRLAHAWLLTGVRGVGKTSTARLIAKALNCIGPDGQGGPTIDPCGHCEPCVAIAEGRYIDVLEQDAASNTQVDKMRELLDGVPYAPASARFKIYVIDEVHMLSTSSFNALLKTLEEPPPHVKFIFATTEAQKLPVTILSRCQRFDLRRIPADKLGAHFAEVAKAEGIEAEPAALALIARAAEGSARDGLSILDQAIAHGGGTVGVETVTDMLGLADRGRVRGLMSCLLAGDGAGAIEALAEQHDMGVDPLAVLRELLDIAHAATRAKLGSAPDATRPPEERHVLAAWGERLSMAQLHRLWQLLLKAHAETATAPLPMEAAEMGLLRIAYASSLPDPGELARMAGEGALDAVRAAPAALSDSSGGRLRGSGAVERSGRPLLPASGPVAPPSGPVAPPSGAGVPLTVGVAPTLPLPPDFPGFVALFEENREPVLAQCLHDHVRPVRYAPPAFDYEPAGDLPRDFNLRLQACLEKWTATRWIIGISAASGEPSLRELEAAARTAAMNDPIVLALLEAFPGAEFLGYEPGAPTQYKDHAP